MKLRLERSRVDAHGAFGVLVDELRDVMAVTLESVVTIDPVAKTVAAQIPNGVYTCKRSRYIRQYLPAIDTFEVLDVVGVKSNPLFGIGNTRTHNLILLGTVKGDNAIFKSQEAFGRFMTFLAGQNEFILEVV